MYNVTFKIDCYRVPSRIHIALSPAAVDRWYPQNNVARRVSVIELHHLTRRFDLPLRIEFAVNTINLHYYRKHPYTRINFLYMQILRATRYDWNCCIIYDIILYYVV